MISQATIGSVTFQAGSAYALTGVPGLELPTVRLFSYDLPGEHFGIHTNALYGRRAFALRGWVLGESVSDFISKRDALIDALDILGGEQVLAFTLANGLTKRITAIPRTLDFSPEAGIPAAAPFSIAFEAAFPYLEGDEQSQSISLALAGGGKVPPDAMPASLGKGSGGVVTITNGGNAPSYPTFRIQGPVTNPSIRNSSLNLELRFTLDLAAGAYLEIDTKRKTVTDQTGRNRYSTLTGDWFTLAPGSTNMQLLADSTDPDATLTVVWRPTYLNL